MMAQDYTWVMVAGIWITVIVAGRQLATRIEDNGNDIESLHEEHRQVESDLQRVDQKQDHIVSRQEMVLERMGMNEQEIQDLREDTARLDARHENDDRFYRGGSSGQPDAGDD